MKIKIFIITFLTLSLSSKISFTQTLTSPTAHCGLELLDVELRSSLIEVANLRLSLNSTDQSTSDPKAHIYLERLAQLKNRFDSLEFAPKEFDSLFLQAITLIRKQKEDPKALKIQKQKKLEELKQQINPLKNRTPQIIAAIEKELNKSQNDITWDDLKKITSINLYKENIDQLQPHDLLGLENLERIDLRDNQLKEIPDHFFKPTPSLKVILLDNNQISLLRSDLFKGLSRIEEIYLSNNLIQELPEKLFHGLRKLRYLTLSHNLIQIVPEKLLKGLDVLWHLNLEHNQIKSLPAKLLLSSYNLVTLKLNHNLLSQLPNDFLKKCYSINFIFINANKFTHFPKAYYKFILDNLSIEVFSLNLQGNPLTRAEQKRLKNDLKGIVNL